MASLDLVSDVAGDAPVLLVVEDAHWLDRPTADVLAFVARRIESDPIVLLAAARDGYPSALIDAGLPERRLAGLDDATATELLGAAAPSLPPTARNRVLREAAGNPLALLELPAVTAHPDGEPSLPGGLPLTERLERAFVSRVSDLPDATRLVLLVAALSDEDAVVEILEAAAIVAGTTAGSRCGGAGRRGGARRPRRQLDPFPAPVDALRGPAERRRAAAPPCARGARRDARRRSRSSCVAPRRADDAGRTRSWRVSSRRRRCARGAGAPSTSP